MRAQIITSFGNPSVFTMYELPKPALKPGHVLIKVHATSVNQIDCKIRSGAVRGIGPEFPAVLHGDVAGVIDAVANDVSKFKVGDEVYGCAGGLKGASGALAEYMLADQNLLAIKPKSLTMLESAALPLVSITAWEALFTKAQLKTEQSILIHGGVGGVGHIAVQLASWMGAMVSTTVLNSDDIPLAQSFGASEVIDVQEEGPAAYIARITDDRGFNVVIDTVGGANLDKSLLAASIGGSVVTTAARSTHDLSPMHNRALSLHSVFMLLPILTNQGREAHGTILSKIAEIVEAGKLRPLIDANQFKFDSISQAHAYLESGKAQGKVVVSII